jgi:predicted GIY-YIG superfamily endonuclease
MSDPTFVIPVDRGIIEGKHARFLIFAHTPHYTYIAYSTSGEVLYVGLSSDPLKRLREHRKSSAWFVRCSRVECFRHPNRPDAARAEWQLIKALKPRFNTVGVDVTPDPEPNPVFARLKHLFGTTYDDPYSTEDERTDAA